ncbi:MAG: hypothetical protein HY699_14750 [Deltaproteobacteria bacterium]|nr:hypothetical protein [Deltaproteobacteria bacterium]
MENDKGRMEVLLENIDSKIDLLVEGHGALKHGQEQIIKQLNALDERENVHYLELKAGQRQLDAKISAVDQRLSTQIAEVDHRLSTQIADVDQRLSAQIAQVDQRLGAKTGALDKRVGRLEKKVDLLNDKLDGKLADHEKRLRKLERRRSAA